MAGRAPVGGTGEIGTAEMMAALRFIRAARQDEQICRQLSRLDPNEGLGPVIAVAAANGFVFGPDSLRAAHAEDWGLRWAGYSFATRGSFDSAASTVAVVNKASSST
jgi:hypothetical protein